MLKLLAWLGVTAAAAYGVWYVAGRPQYRLRMRGLREFAAAVLSLVMLAAAVLAAHRLGIFSLPLVALAFMPFGVAIRWLLTDTRASRQRRDRDRGPNSGGRWAGLALPLLVLAAVALAVLGVYLATLIGPH
jgi:nitroreductase